MSPAEFMHKYKHKLKLIPETGCIERIGAKHYNGYGAMVFEGRTRTPHRVMLELKLRRSIKDGYESSHTCHNRACCNPQHLVEEIHLKNEHRKKHKGYFYDKKSKGYRVRVMVDYKVFNLGLFDNEVDAKSCYEEFVKQHKPHYDREFSPFSMFNMAQEFAYEYTLINTDPDILSSRVEKIRKEIQEFIDAETLEEQFDALLDIVYATLVTAAIMNLDFEEGFKRVHEANMRKEKGPNNSVIKPPGWTPANLEDLV